MSATIHVHMLPSLTTPEDLVGGVVVVIDVLRASTTIIQALAAGASAIIPCAETDEARAMAANLPAGSRVRVGAALLEVTPEPHTGCVKFRQRFGGDALRLTANPRLRELRLRGIYFVVVEAGEVAVGDPIAVLSRAAPAA